MSSARRLHPRLLWRLEHPGAIALCADGARAALEVHAARDGRFTSCLWLLDTRQGADPRPLQLPAVDARMPAWSARGARIACTARSPDDPEAAPQLWVLDPQPEGDAPQPLAFVPTGVSEPRWLPDGRRLLAVSRLWPDLPDLPAQARRLQSVQRRRRQGLRIDDSARPCAAHLLLFEADGGVRDLFAGLPCALDEAPHAFDLSPDGRRVVFACAPEQPGGPRALAELDLAGGTLRWLVRDAAWDCSAPRWAPPSALSGARIAFLARHSGLKHNQPAQLALWEEESGAWSVLSAAWDHEVHAPLQWEEDGIAVLLRAQQQGRQHLWRFDVADRRAEALVRGGWVRAFDKAAGTLVTVADALEHPARVHVHLPGQPPLRVERFNHARLNGTALGVAEPVTLRGAQDEEFQLWLHYPPGFDATRAYPVLQLLPDGPHRAAGERWETVLNPSLLAAQGDCVVARANVHGSSGFGYAFLDSITHRWGELELQDLDAATAWLQRQPWADTRRLFAAGSGYGGFLAAWLNARQSPHAALACLGGVFDWEAMLASSTWPRYVQALGALPWSQPERLLIASPQASAGTMRTPTLLIHAANDARVPLQQALAQHHALQALEVPSRLLVLDAADLRQPPHARRVLGELLAWFRRHDPGAAGG
ncbi:S9 family peptidase [Azohydromonas caseinilytica]|uniref:S9 family peptidase n=1 Tax=Azohydromonas caseinilytica TaxID=2728836 RepID=A0A848FF58_9BURK|nr:prolyl oligopeptidase family serine peptidase [Azohydromonas caseinilytica]NML17736.1 S9 family peptidase [Azohydromonas caseinilytica]